VDELSIASAAKNLYISPQSMSKHIAKLENELNTVLFVRGHPLALTDDGASFYETAKSLLSTMKEYQESITVRRKNVSDIHLAVNFAVGRAILPAILHKLFQLYPNTKVRVLENAPERLKKASLFGLFDIIVSGIALDNLPKTFNTVRLHTKKQLLIVPKRITDQIFGARANEMREQFRQNGADLVAFKNAPFIQMSPSTSAGNITSTYYQYYQITPYFCTTIFGLDTALQLACSGIGIILYSKVYYDAYGEEQRELFSRYVDVFPLASVPGLREGIYLYFPNNKAITQASRFCIDLIKKLFAEYERTEVFSSL
jgi:DNA-binding transcriptional LysR family regulator